MKIAIVGAGPAGCSAAFFCKYFDKDNEHDVYLFERLERKKWEKYHFICGEAVNEELFKEIRPIKPLVKNRINKIKECYPHDIELTFKVRGYILDRPTLLKEIIEKFQELGGNFKISNISKIKLKENKIKIKLKSKVIKYDNLIAADGANSKIRKLLNIRDPLKIVANMFFADNEVIENDTLIFYYDEVYREMYKWVFPNNDRMKLGYPVYKDRKFSPKCEYLSKGSRVIAYGGIDKIVKDRILFVGDAAGQANALTKGGIRSAMIAGKMAAESVIKNDPYYYEKKWEKSPYIAPIYLEALNITKNMSNDELVEHIKPFTNLHFEKSCDKLKFIIRTLLFYRKYLKLYKAYEMCDKWGW